MSRLEELLKDAELALETVREGRSPAFRRAAAEWLEQIALRLRAELAAGPTLATGQNSGGMGMADEANPSRVATGISSPGGAPGLSGSPATTDQSYKAETEVARD